MSLRGWKVPKPTRHPGWCRVLEAHNREDCRKDPCRVANDPRWCVEHADKWRGGQERCEATD